MNHRMRRIVETLACERRYGIADEKGSEYSGAGSTYKEDGADTLRNFKAVAERIGGTPEQVLLTYLLKHMDSITTTVREAADPFYSEVGQALVYARGEGIVSRLDDLRNYADLLECLLTDNEHILPPELLEESVDRSYPDMPWQSPEEVHHEAQEILANEQAEAMLDGNLEKAGLVECLDGVWRPSADKDASVKNPGEKQTPIYARPAVFDPPVAQPMMDALRNETPERGGPQYGETGEWA